MSEHSPLLPCPFCGKQPYVFECNVLEHPTEPGATYNLEYSAKCQECGIEIVEEYRSELTKRWNTRAARDAVAWSAVVKAIEDNIEAEFIIGEGVEVNAGPAADAVLVLFGPRGETTPRPRRGEESSALENGGVA